MSINSSTILAWPRRWLLPGTRRLWSPVEAPVEACGSPWCRRGRHGLWFTEGHGPPPPGTCILGFTEAVSTALWSAESTWPRLLSSRAARQGWGRSAGSSLTAPPSLCTPGQGPQAPLGQQVAVSQEAWEQLPPAGACRDEAEVPEGKSHERPQRQLTGRVPSAASGRLTVRKCRTRASWAW